MNWWIEVGQHSWSNSIHGACPGKARWMWVEWCHPLHLGPVTYFSLS